MRPNQPVDSKCKQKINEAHVYEEGSLIWGSMLNQTNVDKNNNKFYILQLLKDNKSNNFNVWFRWGRVGYTGREGILKPFGGDLEGAKDCFTKKFHEKTGNVWADKDNFETLPCKYTLIHMDCSQKTSPPPETKLDRRTQGLLELICDIEAMEQTAMELEFDFKLSPLGKLTKLQIAEGYRILGELEKQIRDEKFGEEFVHLVNEYYTKIPHNFGFRQKPPLIKTVEMLKNETDLLQVLEGIEIAVKSIGEAKNTGKKLSTIDKCYKDLHCDVSPVEKGSSDHQMIEKYMKLTHGDTHKYSMKITNIYQIERHTETERFKKDIGNRMLLWHGSRTTNFYGILSQGLRIAPPEAPASGYMFGNTYPNEKGYFELEDGTVVPCGEPTQSTANSSLLYNEYIVYNVDQVRIRYLVEVEFGSSPSFQLD